MRVHFSRCYCRPDAFYQPCALSFITSALSSCTNNTIIVCNMLLWNGALSLLIIIISRSDAISLAKVNLSVTNNVECLHCCVACSLCDATMNEQSILRTADMLLQEAVPKERFGASAMRPITNALLLQYFNKRACFEYNFAALLPS